MRILMITVCLKYFSKKMSFIIWQLATGIENFFYLTTNLQFYWTYLIKMYFEDAMKVFFLMCCFVFLLIMLYLIVIAFPFL